MNSKELGRALQVVALEFAQIKKAINDPGLPEITIRHGEHRLSLRYEVASIEYDVNNNRIEIVTGEQK